MRATFSCSCHHAGEAAGNHDHAAFDEQPADVPRKLARLGLDLRARTNYAT